MITDIYLVRHAESDQTIRDAKTRPLTEKGLKDAEALAGFFENIRVTDVFSSPYLRAVQTVAPLAGSRGMSVETDERMREWMGGRPFAQEMFSARMEKLFSDETSQDGGAESMRALKKRTGEFIMHLLSRRAGGAHVVGTHALALTAAVGNYSGRIGYDFLMRLLPVTPFVAHLRFDCFSCVSMRFIQPFREDKCFSEENEYEI